MIASSLKLSPPSNPDWVSRIKNITWPGRGTREEPVGKVAKRTFRRIDHDLSSKKISLFLGMAAVRG
jgi:hypothetical protein